MILPGEERVWVPTAEEMVERRSQTAYSAYQKFCHLGVSHKGLWRKPLTQQQNKVFNLARVGWDAKSIAGRMEMPLASVYDALSKIRHHGYEI